MIYHGKQDIMRKTCKPSREVRAQVETISIFAALISVMVALLSTCLIMNKLVASSPHGRFVTIDGLRGYLAFFVFLHHSCVWYYYLQTGVWELPPFRVFVHFGQIGVALFFMITGFLFFNKLLDDRDRGVDWLRLYVSRFLRLTPLYLFSTALMFLIVWIVTKDDPAQPIGRILSGAMKWIGFRIYGAPDLNGMLGTRHISAGVTWTLPYEWFFYLFLPFIALAVGIKAPIRYLVIAVFAVYVFNSKGYSSYFGWLFLGGIVSAIMVRYDRFNAFAVSKLAACIVICAIALTIILYPAIYDESLPVIFLVVAFSLIAGGNSLFGLLRLKVSRSMGEMAYGIYLLHGILLFVIFKFGFGSTISSQLTPLQYWSVIILATPVLIFVCGLTFRLIEKPSMMRVGALTDWIRSKKKVKLESESAR